MDDYGAGTPPTTATPRALDRLRDRAVLATGVSFTISDPREVDNPLVWVNPAFTATTGYSFDEAVGRNCRFLQGPDTDPGAVDTIRNSVLAGRASTTTLRNYRKDGSSFWNEVAISPIIDDTGRVTHFVGVQADVSARIDAQRNRDAALVRAEVAAGRLALLADFATRLTASLERDDVGRLLADVLVPRLGSWCTVYLTGADGVPHAFARHERMDSDTRVRELVDRLDHVMAQGMASESITQKVIGGELRAQLIRDVDTVPASFGNGNDEVVSIGRQLGIESAIVLPLAGRERILGSISIVADGTRARFDESDLALAQELCSRAALMFENSIMYAREREAAESLQRSLLPIVSKLAGFSVAAEYLTASDTAAVGGDWYDTFALHDGSVGIAVGDAMGHNFDSAAVMGKLSTMLRAYAFPGACAGAVLDSVDDLVAGTGVTYLATCFYGRLRRTEFGAEFEYASAGHPAPVLRLPDGRTEVLEDGHGPMLGLSRLLLPRSHPRGHARRSLPSGSTLIVFTDGLTDSMGEDVDLTSAVDRLAAIVRAQAVDATPRELVSVLAGLAGGGRLDDVAVMAVRVV